MGVDVVWARGFRWFACLFTCSLIFVFSFACLFTCFSFVCVSVLFVFVVRCLLVFVSKGFVTICTACTVVVVHLPDRSDDRDVHVVKTIVRAVDVGDRDSSAPFEHGVTESVLSGG